MKYEAWDYESFAGLLPERKPTRWDLLKEDRYMEEHYERDRVVAHNSRNRSVCTGRDRRSGAE
jgi:hypothetical protein